MISDSEKQDLANEWAAVLNAGSAHALAVAPAAPGTNIFCQDWPIAKKVLQALQSIAPQPGPIIIGVIIALGDAAFAKFCQAGGAATSKP